MDKPIPAYYACYLLRSTIRHASLYVGSTPNPVRRLRQHNGDAKGGAIKTSKDSLRPWEMTCLVSGFPSKISALQFEWAWQNTHLTRHVSPNSRMCRAKPGETRISPKTGHVRKRPGKPRLCLTDRLANLHILLRSSSFERWPLRVTFYAADVHKMWIRWLAQDPARNGGLRKGIEVALDGSIAEGLLEESVPRGIHAVDVGYAALKPRLERSKAILELTAQCDCVICNASLPSTGAGMLICPEEACSCLTHLACLANHFLVSGEDRDALIPTLGSCPTCRRELQWADLVKELSLRMRGEKELTAIFKVPRQRKQKAAAGKTSVLPAVDDEDDVLESDELPDDPIMLEGEDGEDQWFQLPDTSDVEEEAETVVRSGSGPLHRRNENKNARASRSEGVIEESDWDEAECLT